MKSLISLWISLASELARQCHTSTNRDVQRLTARVEHEGLSFLTITLPSFGKDFQKSLDQGKVTHDLFQGFAWRTGLPEFLRGFLESVFDTNDGSILAEPSIDAIYAVQQLTQLFGKIGLSCTDVRVKRSIDGFVLIEEELKRGAANAPELSEFKRIKSLLFSQVLSEVDRMIYDGETIPRHGPGNTAEKLSTNQKYNHFMWSDRLEEYFPARENILPNYSFTNDQKVTHLSPEQELPVRVITVPKTMKTPRIIAIEPAMMQFVQQGILEALVPRLESEYIRTHMGKNKYPNLSYSMIGFTDQVPNQDMACQGSLYGKLATLDLSEASDRVSNQHVRALLEDHPHLNNAVDSCRSRKADVPGHGVIRLAKFASMGSALCFPMEAMVFLTLIFVGIERQNGTPLTRKDIKSFHGSVRVYGDDIIVPVDYVHTVMETLHAFGYKVNSSKSFWTGKFRESCGKEYFEGQDVSPIKFRHQFPSQRLDAQEIISLVSFRNQLYMRGLWETTSWLDSKIKGILPFYPKVEPGSPGLGAHTFLPVQGEKYSRTLHKPLVKAYVVQGTPPNDYLDGAGALLKYFLKRGFLPFDLRHLERTGRPRRVTLKPRWVDPY